MMKKLRDMPGPAGRPITGHFREMQKDTLGYFTGLGREFPDLARLRFFHLDLVAVHAPELVEEVLVRQHSKLKKSWDFTQLRHALGDGLVTSEGALWKRQRKLIQPSFHHDRIQTYGEIMTARTLRGIAAWPAEGVVDVHAALSRITLEIVAEALFGIEVTDVGGVDLAGVIEESLAEFMACFEKLFTGVPLPLSFPTPAHRRMRRALRRMDELVFSLIASRRADAERGETKDDLLGRLIAAADEEGSMSDQQLRDEVVTLILAGHETTALALTFALLLLAQHPAEAARLQDEVAALGAQPSVADVAELPHTRRVVDEAMRLYPPAWGTGREVVEPFELAGYELPPGTQISVASWVTHRDPRFFEDPLAFRPDRWKDPTWPKSAYFPFGAGPRKCIGTHFALLEAVLVLATVSQRYAFELVDDPRNMELVPTVTLRPRHGLRMRLKARSEPQRIAA